MSIDGNWAVSMSSPMGEQNATVTFKADGTNLSGKVESALASQEFSDGTTDGNTAEFSIDITKPMPVTLKFNVAADGDTLSGEVSLGMFGSAPVTGQRI